MCGLVFEDLLKQGGLKEEEKKNKIKAQLLYDAIDDSNGFYKSLVKKSEQSSMNVPFTLEKIRNGGKVHPESRKRKHGSAQRTRIRGWDSRLIYNAMPLAGVEKSVAFMKDFQARHA